ncbi:uncharacterized protein LOC128953874 isoform X3 [Oppia nitens]|uniref:uncharacterized protein LOC128953874 isoform X3 n=1 Tax=Oppia nitens TaxID=1686743 RepID=UPI0023DAAE1F|nr:uncharacterized protein LOC128953874 isoform X3 [Oppia nitens]
MATGGVGVGGGAATGGAGGGPGYHYYDWNKIGEQYKDPIPSTEALTPAEIALCNNHGIEFLERLGSGGFGTVWKVRCSQLVSTQSQRDYTQEELACKIMSIAQFSNRFSPHEAVTEMLHEYRIHKSLDHQYLVRSEDAFHIVDAMTGFPHVRHLHFMELCSGSLADFLRLRGRMSEIDAKSWLRMMSRALRYLHKQDIAHLDIKIENILYKYDQTTKSSIFKLSDLGLARIATKICGRVGTEIYRAPEQPTRAKALHNPYINSMPYETKPCDIYSLALAVCETLGGHRTHQQIMGFICGIKDQQEFKRIQSGGLQINTMEFVHLLQGMLEINPKRRFTIRDVMSHPWYKAP